MDAIVVKNLSKKFKISYRKKQTVLARLLNSISGKIPKKEIWALRDMSFNVKKGEFIGIIGGNGSGKSTLLRVLSRIYKPYLGFFNVLGKTANMIDLNRVLNNRLTLRDNIYYICSLLDIGKKEIKQKFNSIVKFAELEEYTDTKLYQLSKGMRARLAVSIILVKNFDILIIDEIFSGEDEHFKSKILKKILEFKKQGKTILLVSHDLNLIEKFCDRLIWMNEGEIKKIGNPKEIVKEYKKQNVKKNY